jgi:c-di-GMP-binding flagellar brake protein YcgR|tara:strand:+ start:175 stop:510 length:336 start_codon:yes stop_codon:yes gene_type:complete
VDQPPEINRRILPRINAPFTVYIPETGAEVRGLDISFGGLMCLSSLPIWPGNSTRLELRLPGLGQDLHFTATVAEIVSHEGQLAMRMRFDGVEDSVRRQIARWMSRVSLRS